LLDPTPPVEPPALRCHATFGIFTVGTPKPLIARPLDAIVPPLREHEMRMRVVRLVVRIATGVNL
jgi:hypothetical protein